MKGGEQSLTPIAIRLYNGLSELVHSQRAATRTIGLCLLRYQNRGGTHKGAGAVQLAMGYRSPHNYREKETLLVARFISYISSAWALVMFVNQVCRR